MLSRESFIKTARNRYVPHLAFPRTQPDKYIELCRLSPITLERDEKIGIEKDTKVIRISTAAQRKVYNALLNLKEIKPYVIGISSEPTDLLALELAGCICYSFAQRLDPTWMWYNSCFRLKEEEPFHKVVVIHNITPKLSNPHMVRNLITSMHRSLRIVVIGGINAASYFNDVLHYPVSGVIHIVGLTPGYLPGYKRDKYTKKEVEAAKAFNSREFLELMDVVKLNVLKMEKNDD